MSYIKKISKDMLQSKRFQYLAFDFSNLDTAIIERKAIRKFQMNTILVNERYQTKSVLEFYIELDKSYCDNKLLEYEYYSEGSVPIEEQQSITDMINNKIGINIGAIYLLDKNLKEYDQYYIFYRDIDIHTNYDCIRKKITDKSIYMLMNTTPEIAIINDELSNATYLYLQKREQGQQISFMKEKKAVEEFMKDNDDDNLNSVYFYRIYFPEDELNTLNRNGYITIAETVEAIKKEPPMKYPSQYEDMQIIIEKYYFSDEYTYCKVTFNRKWKVIKIETSKE